MTTLVRRLPPLLLLVLLVSSGCFDTVVGSGDVVRRDAAVSTRYETAHAFAVRHALVTLPAVSPMERRAPIGVEHLRRLDRCRLRSVSLLN